jgi:predicted metalloprotease with PDZ domain
VIDYQIVPISPEAHLFQVSLKVSDPAPDGQEFTLPAWIRGSYMIRDFARNIVSLNAYCETNRIPLRKIDKQTWKLEPSAGPVTLEYNVYAWDLSVRAAHLDNTHGYFNGPSVFLAVKGQETAQCRLKISPAETDAGQSWSVWTGLSPLSIDERGYGDYLVPDYEALLDYPVEMGELAVSSFEIQGVPHKFAVSGRQRMDLQRVVEDLEKICAVHISLFGEMPVDNYLFLLWVVGKGYGGLEHRNSTSLMISREDLPVKGEKKVTPGYRKLLGLCSHEYFHLWNVKRITPEVFQQQGLAEEVYTRQLWVFEGITSYYDDLALVRSGVISRKAYLGMLAETVTRVMRGSGRLKQTLEESSFDAWTKFYKQDENAPNSIVSYYAKGALFALALDLKIRLDSGGSRSLDDVMRLLWKQHGRIGKGLPEGAFETVTAEASGLELDEFFSLGVRSTEELPLAELLGKYGINMSMLPAKSSSDKGRVVSEKPETVPPKPVLGATLKQDQNELRLLQVFDGGAAQQAGLAAGDGIVAVDGLRLNEKQLESYLAASETGESLTIHAFRRDELMTFQLPTLPARANTCVLHLPENLAQEQAGLINNWLHDDGN